MADFKKLEVWQKAHQLALDVHRAAVKIRGAQYVSLRSQMIRSAMSIPSNIVEGREQRSEKDFVRFLGYAKASSAELEYHLLVARDMYVIPESTHEALVNQLATVQKMLHGLIARLVNP